MSINDNIKHMGGLSGSPDGDDSAHEQYLRMKERIQRSVDKRKYLEDYMPEVGASDWYAAPHILQVRHYSTPSSSTQIDMSRDQALHLVVQIMQWLTNNPDSGAL